MPDHDEDLVSRGRRFRALDDRCDVLDDRWRKVRDPAEKAAAVAAVAAFEEADEERSRLFEQVFDFKADNLAEAAVLAVHAFERIGQMDAADKFAMIRGGQLDEYLADIRWALANVISEAMKTTGLNPAEFGWSDFAGTLNEVLEAGRWPPGPKPKHGEFEAVFDDYAKSWEAWRARKLLQLFETQTAPAQETAVPAGVNRSGIGHLRHRQSRLPSRGRLSAGSLPAAGSCPEFGQTA